MRQTSVDQGRRHHAHEETDRLIDCIDYKT